MLSVDPFDPDHDREFVDLLGRLRIVIRYASLYGDEDVLDWSRGTEWPEARGLGPAH